MLPVITAETARPRWRWAVLAVAAFAWWAAQPAQMQAQAQATEATGCPAIRQPENVGLHYRLTFDQHHIGFVEVRQVTSIDIPARQWALANDLTLSTNSPKYRNAMRCLLREKRNPAAKFAEWHPEWRAVSEATEQKDVVAVRYESWNLIDSAGEFEVGPWTIDAKPDQDWKAALHSPDALRGATRKTVEIDPGGLEINDAPGARSANEASRVWTTPKPDTEASIVPPRKVAQVLSRRDPWIAYLGVTSWWVFGSALIALSAWPFKKSTDSDKAAAGRTAKAAAKTLANTALQWAGLSAALALTLVLLLQLYPTTSRWRAFTGISSGLALVLLARPWLPLVKRSDDSKKELTRHTVVVVACTAAAIGLLVIVSPQLFALSWNLTPTAPPSLLGIAGLALLEMSMVWLWFTAMAAWGWRFAREGKLGGSSAGKGRNAPGHHLRRVTATGAALAVVAALVVTCHVLSFESRWRRADWLGEADSLFGNDHMGILGQQLANFPSFGPSPLWAYSHTSVLTGIALVALLHLSHRAGSGVTSLGPKGWDLLLVAAIFAVVALRVPQFAGSAGKLYGLWLPLNMLALYALVKAGRRWSVLGRVDRKAGTHKAKKQLATDQESHVAAELGTAAGHRRLMGKARRCRDLLHRLHLVDHGHAQETTRRTLENQLGKLHHWQPATCSRDCLPDPVSVVDVALSWGPHRRWWRNALNAARWAAVFGVLPSMVTVWYENAYDPGHWALMLDSATGVPDVVWRFLAQEISFAGAGLVLGALWRVLPGERGPMRALSLFIAWLIPICVVAAFSRGIDRKTLGLSLLSVVLMLMVLTLTSMWMDTDTFSRERPYWTKRLGLLASIYQVHGLSGQIAFLIMQLATAATIWRQITAA
ncbi:DUF6185 family protein [Streptomyces sp. NPDC037389]|uniref:DUF6185 family protein n=1 Tax=Streptomyces sp. NPDC037389 TaxID=3155369 RepID=UPI0033EC07C6